MAKRKKTVISAMAKTTEGGYVFLFRTKEGVRFSFADESYDTVNEVIVPNNQLVDISKFFCDMPLGGQLPYMLDDEKPPEFPEKFEPRKV